MPKGKTNNPEGRNQYSKGGSKKGVGLIGIINAFSEMNNKKRIVANAGRRTAARKFQGDDISNLKHKIKTIGVSSKRRKYLEKSKKLQGKK